MKMITVELEIRSREKKNFDVILPLYRRHDIDDDYGGTTIYCRVNTDMSMDSVEIDSDGSVTIGYEPRYEFGFGEEDYLLGRGKHASNEAEFMEAVSKAYSAINNIADRNP